MIYKLGHIYAIWDCEDHDLVYYGSTQNIKERMMSHKKPSNNYASKQIIERGNYEYAILETHENIDKYDLVERERWYILNKVCVNKCIPHRTRDEYYQNNKEKILKQQAKWLQDNKDYHSKYKEDHRHEINLNRYKYYHKHKDKINEQKKQKVRCPYCDKEFRKTSLKRHIKQSCKGQITHQP
tara:strand:+ start:100 stop:648 length:549 start_codon:yes stop_codon:yes gene_type:complete